MLTFVDTGVWYASVVPTDPKHVAVRSWLRANNPPLVTTDFVIDETLTLLRMRGQRTRAIVMGKQFFDLVVVTIEPICAADLRRAWELFSQNPDRDWSFTDCTSRAIIERFHIKQALSLDSHFTEFGITVVP
jgi:predicted nucleic acid-binding protein